MNKPVGKDGKLLYTSAPQAFAKIFTTEGPFAFYKGFVPNFMRIGTWRLRIPTMKTGTAYRI